MKKFREHDRIGNGGIHPDGDTEIGLAGNLFKIGVVDGLDTFGFRS